MTEALGNGGWLLSFGSSDLLAQADEFSGAHDIPTFWTAQRSMLFNKLMAAQQPGNPV